MNKVMNTLDLNTDHEAMPMLPMKDSTTSTHFLVHKAAKDGSLDVVQRYLEEKRNVAVMDDKEMSPLHYAAQYNRVNILTALIKAGIDVNVRGEGNITALHLSAR
jgi:ankyrin repeat protein